MSDVTTFDPEVEQRLVEITEKFNQFIARQKTEIIRANELHSAKVKQVWNEHRELLKHLQDAMQREQALQSQLEKEIGDANTSQSRLADLKLKEKQLADERKILEKQVIELKDKVEERRAELSKLRENQQRQGELDLPETMIYEQLLGFKIDGIQEDLLRFVFTNIDSKEPQREYSLDLDVGQHLYKLANIQPEIPEEEKNAILSQLNKTRDLTQFLKRVRQEFKKL